jgi:hypothetical protein
LPGELRVRLPGSLSAKPKSQSRTKVRLECRITYNFLVSPIQEVLDGEKCSHMSLKFVPSADVSTDVSGRVIDSWSQPEEI